MPALVKDTYALVKVISMPWLVFKEILNNTVWEPPEYIDPTDFIPELKQ